MNTIKILEQMQKSHKSIQNNLDELEKLKLICSTEIGTEINQKQFQKLLIKTQKTFNTLKTSYNLISKQKLKFPPEFFEIGMEIDNFEDRLMKL